MLHKLTALLGEILVFFLCYFRQQIALPCSNRVQCCCFSCTIWTLHIWWSLKPPSRNIPSSEPSVSCFAFHSNFSLRLAERARPSTFFWLIIFVRGVGSRGGGEKEKREVASPEFPLSRSQAKPYAEQQQAEKTVLYCFRAAGNKSLPETQQTAITHRREECQSAAQPLSCQNAAELLCGKFWNTSVNFFSLFLSVDQSD